MLETPYLSLTELARRQFPLTPALLLRYPLRTDRRIGEVACPIHIFHGTHDEVIPYSASERLVPLIRAEHTLWCCRVTLHLAPSTWTDQARSAPSAPKQKHRPTPRRRDSETSASGRWAVH